MRWNEFASTGESLEMTAVTTERFTLAEYYRCGPAIP